MIWLDSGEYEAWAAALLADAQGQVNRRGRGIVARLNAIVPAYYWWFEDADLPLTVCPVCWGPLAEYEGRNFRVCAACRILV